MPRKPRKLLKMRQAAISPALKEYFETGGYDDKSEESADAFMIQSTPKMKKAWKSHREQIMLEWIKKYPCSRPWAWWELDSPRWARKFNAYFDGTLPEPRKRLGGTGTSNFEDLAYVPHFSFGIPTGWLDQWTVDYYNGQALDVHGELIKTPYKKGNFEGVAIDLKNPPAFESQAVFLQRHDLLTTPEKAYLTKHPRLLEPERVELEKSS